MKQKFEVKVVDLRRAFTSVTASSVASPVAGVEDAFFGTVTYNIKAGLSIPKVGSFVMVEVSPVEAIVIEPVQEEEGSEEDNESGEGAIGE